MRIWFVDIGSLVDQPEVVKILLPGCDHRPLSLRAAPSVSCTGHPKLELGPRWFDAFSVLDSICTTVHTYTTLPLRPTWSRSRCDYRPCVCYECATPTRKRRTPACPSCRQCWVSVPPLWVSLGHLLTYPLQPAGHQQEPGLPHVQQSNNHCALAWMVRRHPPGRRATSTTICLVSKSTSRATPRRNRMSAQPSEDDSQVESSRHCHALEPWLVTEKNGFANRLSRLISERFHETSINNPIHAKRSKQTWTTSQEFA